MSFKKFLHKSIRLSNSGCLILVMNKADTTQRINLDSDVEPCLVEGHTIRSCMIGVKVESLRWLHKLITFEWEIDSNIEAPNTRKVLRKEKREEKMKK